jgi:hypothetical protein
MRIYKNLFLGLSIVLLYFTGCKKGDDEAPDKVIPPVVEAGTKVMVPVQIGTGKSKMVISYTDGLAFSKIEFGDGRSIVMTYTKMGKPLGLEGFKDNKLVSATDYVLDEKGRVIKGKMAVIKADRYVLTGHYELKYNETGQVAEVDYVDLNDRQVDRQEKRYDAGGNLIGEKGMITDFVYSYDLKNGLFKYVNYAWLLAIEKEDILFLSGINNIKGFTNVLNPGDDQSFSYVYNGYGYPEVIHTLVNGSKNTAKVIYKEIRTD